MKIASITDIAEQFSDYVVAAEDELVVITRDGQPVAVLLSVANEEELEQIALAHSRPLGEVLAAARQQIRAKGGISHAEFWTRIEAEPGADQTN